MDIRKKQQFYSAVHMTDDVCRNSSSGGAFTAITDSWFQRYGDRAVVYGCALDEKLKAKHIRANNKLERDLMRGSKYIGSDLSGIMNLILGDLQEGYYVAFSGTPCQIAGLLCFLRAKGFGGTDQLLTIEITCHGVGSVRFFQDYVLYYENKYGKKVSACSFRGKKRPGKHQQMILCFEDGSMYESPSIRNDGFYSAYLQNLIIRPSCFQCRYAQKNRHADITIADFWEEKTCSRHGKSLIISNSSKGEFWVKHALDTMWFEAITEDCVHQPNMIEPTWKPDHYELFWDTYRKNGYQSAQYMLGNNTIKARIRSVVVWILYKLHIDELRWAIRRMRH